MKILCLLTYLCIYGRSAIAFKTKHLNINSHGVLQAGPCIQKITPGLGESTDGLFYSTDLRVLAYVLRQEDKVVIWNKINGEISSQFIEEIDGEDFAFAYPQYLSQNKHLIGSDANVRECEIPENGSYTLSAPTYITTDTGYHIRKAHADQSGVLFMTLTSINDKKHRGGRLYNYKGKIATLVKQFTSDVTDFVWTNNNKTLFLISEYGTSVRKLDYDISSSTITRDQLAFKVRQLDFCENDIIMKSIEIDTNNRIWIGTSNGYIVQLDTDYNVIFRLKIPASQVQSLTFGVCNNTGLFVGTKSKWASTQKKSAVYYVSGINGTGVADIGVVL